ncbi:MAG: hypothetical protein Q27BPR15_19690 [Rhodobacter sp. CACIA14H1]|nr:MAG: hypothetical protein Q27BPR15_19690 [Rhodobacter sp. CACIA14H1]
MASETKTERTSALEQFLQPLDSAQLLMMVHALHLVRSAKSKAWKTRRMRELVALMEQFAA